MAEPSFFSKISRFYWLAWAPAAAVFVLVGIIAYFVCGMVSWDSPYAPYWLVGISACLGLSILLTGWFGYLAFQFAKERMQLQHQVWLEEQAKEERGRLGNSKPKEEPPKQEPQSDKLKKLLQESVQIAKELRIEIAEADAEGKGKKTHQTFPQPLLDEIFKLQTELIELRKEEINSPSDSIAQKEPSHGDQ
ncbi:MAG: hypothetical protein KIPDCIKN_02465 [Haliscomenobacter sp.]|nr:hypothetical protein [Haliscomenobacter sp.]